MLLSRTHVPGSAKLTLAMAFETVVSASCCGVTKKWCLLALAKPADLLYPWRQSEDARTTFQHEATEVHAFPLSQAKKSRKIDTIQFVLTHLSSTTC